MLRNRLHRMAPALQGPLAALAYLLAWVGLFQVSQRYWYLPAGLRFGALLMAPRRLWPWLIAAEWLAGLALCAGGLHPVGGAAACLLSVLPQPLLVVLVMTALRLPVDPGELERPERIVRLLLAALLAALAVSAFNTVVVAGHGNPAPSHLLRILAGLALGNYVGILLLAPLLVMLLYAPIERAPAARLLRELLLVADDAPAARYARVLTLVPVLYFAFRFGWRGANLSLLAASALLANGTAPGLTAEAPAEAQLFLAVAGSGALLLGAATDALRQSGLRLALQNARLNTANQRLDQLARRLEAAAQSNLRAEENERKRIAAELHDELGQNLTAIQIRVKIAQSRLESAGLGDVASSINDIVTTMRRSVRGLLESLRPSALAEFGLARALAEGPPSELVRSAGMHYSVELHGDLRALDEALRNTVYRIVQEAATNCIRHAHATRFTVRLRCGRRNEQLLTMLELRDDGVGIAGMGEGLIDLGRGLAGMRERVLALGGVFRLEHAARGVRLRILLRQPLPR